MVQSEQLGTIVSLLDNAPIYLMGCVIQKRKTYIILSQILSYADNIFFNRSFVGANSGVITQRDVKMYEQREDTVTYVRVHSIPGMMNYINFEVRLFHRLKSIFLGKFYLPTTYVIFTGQCTNEILQLSK